MVGTESAEDCGAHAEPPDPDVLEIDPTCRYIKVFFFLNQFMLNSFIKLLFGWKGDRKFFNNVLHLLFLFFF